MAVCPVSNENGFRLMSTRQDSAPAPTVRSRDDLIAWIAAGSKPAERWRIGTEHEKFLFLADTLRPVPYAGPAQRARADGEPDMRASAGCRSWRATTSSP